MQSAWYIAQYGSVQFAIFIQRFEQTKTKKYT